ncbi:MAG: site-specific integrase [Dethiobacter sp.]|nr:MAG: site-specific integrase [Dethiobacter sp.]
MNGHLEKRYKSSWTIVIEFGVEQEDGTLKRKRITKSVKGVKKDAQQEMARMMVELENGTYIEPDALTVKKYLEHWLEAYGTPNLAPSTLVSYKLIINKHIVPALGHILLQKLQPLQIQSYYSKALESGRIDGKRGLSQRTVQYHHRVLREALQHAVKWRLIGLNAADACEAPKPPKPEMHVLDKECVKELQKLIRGHQDEHLIITALFTGMRQGELLGLRWQDVELEQKAIRIQQTVGYLHKLGFVFRPMAKNKKSPRQIVLPANVVSTLAKRKVICAQEKLKEKNYAKHNLVFCTPTGEPLLPCDVGHRFKKLATTLGQPGLRFHDLRYPNLNKIQTFFKDA